MAAIDLITSPVSGHCDWSKYFLALFRHLTVFFVGRRRLATPIKVSFEFWWNCSVEVDVERIDGSVVIIQNKLHLNVVIPDQVTSNSCNNISY